MNYYELDLHKVEAIFGSSIREICQSTSLACSFMPDTFTGITEIRLMNGDICIPLSPTVRSKVLAVIEDFRQRHNEIPNEINGNISFNYENGVLEEVVLAAD